MTLPWHDEPAAGGRPRGTVWAEPRQAGSWSAYPGFGAPPPVPGPTRPSVAEAAREVLADALVPAVVALLLAAPAGLVWARQSPPVALRAVGGGVALADSRAEAIFGGDAGFFFVSVLAGLLTGGLAWALRRRGTAVVPAAAGLAGLAAARVALAVGNRAREMAYPDAVRVALTTDQLDRVLGVRATAVLLTWSFAAVVGYLVLGLALDRPTAEQRWGPAAAVPWSPAEE